MVFKLVPEFGAELVAAGHFRQAARDRGHELAAQRQLSVGGHSCDPQVVARSAATADRHSSSLFSPVMAGWTRAAG
ncbi:hypothetical protein AB0D34_46475 [Streptomyces sp. NPDC048420]|uniref:hypothetical protein n=1 Tax=Streptomyces sp. NPDC048420 TaxID=3155755 RepID=UPI00342D207D